MGVVKICSCGERMEVHSGEDVPDCCPKCKRVIEWLDRNPWAWIPISIFAFGYLIVIALGVVGLMMATQHLVHGP